MGYPTPDIPLYQAFKCVKIYVPTSEGDVFLSVLMGQIGELTKEYYWIPFGDMTPEQASFLWSQSLALTDATGEPCGGEVDCQDILDCMSSPAGVAQSNYVAMGLVPAVQNAKLGAGVATLDGCSEDHVWGAVSNLVDYLIATGLDTIEQVETSTNLSELIAQLLGAIFSAETASALLDYFNWLQDTIGEAFEAQLTVALTDEYKCDLFCLYIENCQQLSARDVAQYFNDRLSSVSVMDTLFNLLDFAITGSWSGTQIVDIVMLGVAGVMTVLESPVPQLILGNIYKINEVFALGANNPDSDWALLCDDCPEDGEGTLEWDFTESQGGWELSDAGRGAYTASVGFTSTQGSGQTGVWIQKALPSGCIMKGIEVDWVASAGVWRRASVGRNNITSSSGQQFFFDSNGTSSGAESCANDVTIAKNWLLVFINTENNSLSGTITKIKLRWQVSKPTGYTADDGITLVCE